MKSLWPDTLFPYYYYPPSPCFFSKKFIPVLSQVIVSQIPIALPIHPELLLCSHDAAPLLQVYPLVAVFRGASIRHLNHSTTDAHGLTRILS